MQDLTLVELCAQRKPRANNPVQGTCQLFCNISNRSSLCFHVLLTSSRSSYFLHFCSAQDQKKKSLSVKDSHSRETATVIQKRCNSSQRNDYHIRGYPHTKTSSLYSYTIRPNKGKISLHRSRPTSSLQP